MLKNKTFLWLHGLFALLVALCLLFAEDKSLKHLALSMAWNVFLALLAFDFSYFLVGCRRMAARLLLALVWLIFYPNTFYMLTDALHFADWLSVNGVIRLDRFQSLLAFNLLSFSILFGLFLGACSAKMVVNQTFRKLWSKIGALVILSFLSSVGIYVGRSDRLRLNSWDLVLRPFSTLDKIFQSINAETLPFILSFTVSQLFIIALFYSVKFDRIDK